MKAKFKYFTIKNTFSSLNSFFVFYNRNWQSRNNSSKLFLNMLLLLFALCQSSTRHYHFDTNYPIIRLDPFGFNQNASFTFQVETSNASSLHLFLLSKKIEKKYEFNHFGLQLSVCFQPSFVTELNSSFQIHNQFIFWKGNIPSKYIYYPYIINCNLKFNSYSIQTNFINIDSHLDFRDFSYSRTYLIFSMVYIFITLIWLINIIFKPRFLIPLNCGFCFSVCVKSILCLMKAQHWENRRIGIINYDYNGSNLCKFVDLIYTLSFFSMPMLVLSGWCIYRDEIVSSEFTNIFLPIISLVFGNWIVRSISNLNQMQLVCAIALICFGLPDLIKNVVDYLSIAASALSLIHEDEVYLRKKIELSLYFSFFFIIILLLNTICYSLTLFNDAWPVIESIIVEIGFLISHFGELWFFLYRKKFEVPLSLSQEQELSDKLDQNGLTIIEDPVLTYVAVVF